MESKQKTFGFPRRKRITRPEDFRRVFKTGKRFNHRFFNVYYLASEADNARLGVAVGKRYFRKAVTRNRLKRVIRESFRNHAQRLLPMDIIFVARSAAAEASADEFAGCLAAFLSGNRLAGSR